STSLMLAPLYPLKKWSLRESRGGSPILQWRISSASSQTVKLKPVLNTNSDAAYQYLTQFSLEMLCHDPDSLQKVFGNIRSPIHHGYLVRNGSSFTRWIHESQTFRGRYPKLEARHEGDSNPTCDQSCGCIHKTCMLGHAGAKTRC